MGGKEEEGKDIRLPIRSSKDTTPPTPPTSQTPPTSKKTKNKTSHKKKNSIWRSSKFGKFVQAIFKGNPFVFLIELFNIIFFFFALASEKFNLAFSIFIIFLVIDLVILFLADFISDFVALKSDGKTKSNDVREWFGRISIIQVIIIILMLSFLLYFVRINDFERYYGKIDPFIGSIIETKFATISPSITPSPTFTEAPKPSNTPTVGGSELSPEDQARAFVGNLFGGLTTYLNDRYQDTDVNLPSYFCVGKNNKNDNAYPTFMNYYLENFINKYKDPYKVTCKLEDIDLGYYDKGHYWFVHIRNKCEVFCSRYFSELGEIKIEILKPDETQKSFCIYKFELIK
jgi:hypothetical protein